MEIGEPKITTTKKKQCLWSWFASQANQTGQSYNCLGRPDKVRRIDFLILRHQYKSNSSKQPTSQWEPAGTRISKRLAKKAASQYREANPNAEPRDNERWRSVYHCFITRCHHAVSCAHASPEGPQHTHTHTFIFISAQCTHGTGNHTCPEETDMCNLEMMRHLLCLHWWTKPQTHTHTHTHTHTSRMHLNTVELRNTDSASK